LVHLPVTGYHLAGPDVWFGLHSRTRAPLLRPPHAAFTTFYVPGNASGSCTLPLVLRCGWFCDARRTQARGIPLHTGGKSLHVLRNAAFRGSLRFLVGGTACGFTTTDSTYTLFFFSALTSLTPACSFAADASLHHPTKRWVARSGPNWLATLIQHPLTPFPTSRTLAFAPPVHIGRCRAFPYVPVPPVLHTAYTLDALPADSCVCACRSRVLYAYLPLAFLAIPLTRGPHRDSACGVYRTRLRLDWIPLVWTPLPTLTLVWTPPAFCAFALYHLPCPPPAA